MFACPAAESLPKCYFHLETIVMEEPEWLNGNPDQLLPTFNESSMSLLIMMACKDLRDAISNFLVSQLVWHVPRGETRIELHRPNRQ